MIKRSGFITNSSSTSFIFFGNTFQLDDLFSFVATYDPEKGYDEHNLGLKLEDIANSLNSNKKSVVGAHYAYEEQELNIYAKKSFLSLEDGGSRALPLDRLCEMNAKEKTTDEWSKALIDFYERYNIESSPPEWCIAINVSW